VGFVVFTTFLSKWQLFINIQKKYVLCVIQKPWSDTDVLTENELSELKVQTRSLGEAYQTVFPKTDPALVYDLISRIQQDPENSSLVYTVEVFTKEGTNSEKSRDHILQTTGTVPSVYDNGTHYVSTIRLTLEMLKKLNDIEYVLDVMGDYTGSAASIGPQHAMGDWKRKKDNNK
jgi:hypothetical protein